MNRWLLGPMVLACACAQRGSSPDAEIVVIEDIDGHLDIPTDLPDAGPHMQWGGTRADLTGRLLRLSNDRIEVEVSRESATIRFSEVGGRLVVRDARSRATLLHSSSGEPEEVACAGGVDSWAMQPLDDALGSGIRLTVTCTTQDPFRQFMTTIALRGGVSFVTMASQLKWHCAGCAEPTLDCCGLQDLRVTGVAPLSLAPGGAVFLGEDPASHVILDNGYDLYFDFAANVHRVADANSILFAPGSSASWNAAIVDPQGGRSLIAGFLSADRGTGVVVVDFDEAHAAEDDGRKGFTRFDGLTYFMDRGRAPAWDGAEMAVASEEFYLDVTPASAHDGLEAFAYRYAARIGKAVWTDVPSGWNSWGGGSGSGGYGTNIHEALILQNLQSAVADFAPWGMKYYLIDDGWQDRAGDWNSHPERFPSHEGVEGMRWIADRIREAGMIPGLWIAPFGAAWDSALVSAHPDWCAPISDTGKAFVPPDLCILDLSRPEVLDWLDGLFRRITQDWGYRWIKMDFSYYALFTTALSDPRITPSEAFHNALVRIRDAIGPETFFLMISATGLCLDVADGARITLDNMPWWGDPVGVGDQGIKVTYRTIARRYYLNHRVWINHPDLLFFRENRGLTFSEARTWASAVALSGGIVKLGESYLDMHEHPAWLDTVRRMLPVYPHSGRPLDLFAREYPEVWDLPVQAADAQWHVLGLFHWGRNRDIGSAAWEDEVPKTLSVRVSDLGLEPAGAHLVVDSWEGTARVVDSGVVSETLEPRTARVLIVRPMPADPAVVWTSRHLLGGAVEVLDERYDPATRELRFTLRAVRDHPFQALIATAGMQVQTVQVDGDPAAQTEPADPSLVRVSFLAATASPTVRVTFAPLDGPPPRSSPASPP